MSLGRRAVLMGGLLVGLGAARAGTGVDLTTEFVSEYIFRGANQHQGASVQTSLNYNLVDTLTATMWTNIRLEQALALSETDYSLKWTWLPKSKAQLNVGGIYYQRNRALVGRETGEVFAGLDFDLPLRPSLYAFYDWDSHPGGYYQLGLSHKAMLPHYRGTFDTSLQLGLDSGDRNVFRAARLSLAITRMIGEWRIAPGVDLNFAASAVDPHAHAFRPVFRFAAARAF